MNTIQTYKNKNENKEVFTVADESIDMRPALLYSDTQSIVCFSLIEKCVNLNDLDWLFHVKHRRRLHGSDGGDRPHGQKVVGAMPPGGDAPKSPPQEF